MLTGQKLPHAVTSLVFFYSQLKVYDYFAEATYAENLVFEEGAFYVLESAVYSRTLTAGQYRVILCQCTFTQCSHQGESASIKPRDANSLKCFRVSENINEQNH